MTKKEAIALLKTLSFPVFNRRAPVGTLVPFGVIVITQPDNFSADNYVYVEQHEIRFLTYTTGEDPEIEAEVKTLFKENEIYWTSDSNILDDQATVETEYTFGIIGNEPDPEPTPPEPTPEPDDGGEGNGV